MPGLMNPTEEGFQQKNGRPRSNSSETQQTYGTYDDKESVNTASEPLLPPNHPRKWPKKRKGLFLLIVSGCSFVVSLSQAIYLPSIKKIIEDFETTNTLVFYSLTLPLVVLGIMNNFIGPLSEYLGRRYLHLFGMLVFTGASVGCAMAPTIWSFIAFRVVQALGSAAPSIVGSGTVSDMYDLQERGKALGFFLLGPLIGPVLGPAIGGALATVFNWQYLFWVITGLGGFFTLLSLLVLRETLIKEENSKCIMPWEPLKYFTYGRIASIIFMLTVTFSGFFSVNVNFAIVLSSPEYGLSPAVVGLCYLPFGFGLLIGSIVGGRSSDRLRIKGGTPEHRLVPSLLFIPLNGLCIIGQGWAFEYKLHLSILIILSFFLGVTFTVPRTGSNTYAIEYLKNMTGKDAASSITGITYAVMLPVAAIVAQCSVRGVEELGQGVFLTIIGGSIIICVLPMFVFTLKEIKKSKYSKVPTEDAEDGIN